MGRVVLAEDPRIERLLAIKTVRLEGRAGDVEERKLRLLREAKAAGKVIHPHVVTLFDAGEDGDTLFLAFEYVKGADLASRLEAGPPLSLAEALRTVRQAADGLGFAHQQGIVHRDIKPSNLMLDERGNVKISDFGIAKMAGQATELTMTGSVVGSPHYLSPEQIRGEDLDGRSDLFSLGVVLYELLSRKRPFEAETLTSLIYQILNQEPPPVEVGAGDVAGRLNAVVRKAMAKDKNERYQTAAELVADLAAIERSLSSSVLSVPAATFLGPMPKPAAVTAPLTSAGPAVVPPPPPPVASATQPTVHLPPAAAPVPLPPAKKSLLPVLLGVGGLLAALVVLAVVVVIVFSNQGEPVKDAETAEKPSESESTDPSKPPPTSQELSKGPVEDLRQTRPEAAKPPPVETRPPAPAENPPVRVVSVTPVETRPTTEQPGNLVPPVTTRPPEPPPPAEVVERPRDEEPASRPAMDGLATGMILRFPGAPPDAFLLVDRTVIGRIGAINKSGGYQLTEPGEHELALKKDGFTTRRLRINADPARGTTNVPALLAHVAAETADAADLETVRVQEAIGFDVEPKTARVAVNGADRGLASSFGGRLGGGWLRLERGIHRISLTAPGHRRIDFKVEVSSGAPEEKKKLHYSLQREGS